MKRDYESRSGFRCLRYVLLCFITLLNFHFLYGQPDVKKPARILFLLDASSSMGSSWSDSNSRFNTASRIVTKIVDSIHHVNPDVAFAIRVFGNQFPAQEKNCFDSKLEVYFSLGNEAAKLLNISLVTLTDLMKRDLPFHKQRGRVYFLRSELMAFIKKTTNSG